MRTLSLLSAIISAVIIPLAPVAQAAAPYDANWASLDKRPLPGWFQDAKFGIFIHWGPYSVPAWAKRGTYAESYWNRLGKDAAATAFHKKNYGENFSYMDFAPRFTAELFDAKEWAALFKRAGARYVVPTSKHHDGFALWPSEHASSAYGRPWNAVETGPKRDLLGELAAATRAQGLKFGFYISLHEWFHPLWKDPKARKRFVNEHYIPQFKDVVTRYQPSLIFGDGEWDMPSKDWKSEELLAWLYNESPSKEDVVVNDRWGKETRHRHGGYYTTEYGAGLQDGAHAWEENRGIAYSFGLNRAERIGDYKTSRELVLVLADLVSRGGNLLLNIGPAADGTIPPIMEERLLDIGAWLDVNGEAIYGTRPAGRPCQWTEGKRPKQQYSHYKAKYNLLDTVGQKPKGGNAVKQVFYTQKGSTLYAICAGWPEAQLILRDVDAGDSATVTLLGSPGELSYTRDGAALKIKTPAFGPDDAPCKYAYTFKITNAHIAPEGKTGTPKQNSGIRQDNPPTN
ncbi:MAG: alpha-L-fucosidase [Puniceicoccales bacterium]|nr:alpha-L-fucosidase [Puniceicoccales bacterium]